MLFLKNNKSKKLKVFCIYVLISSLSLAIQLLLRYYFRYKEGYFLSIRIHLAIEFVLLAYFLMGSFYHKTAKNVIKFSAAFFLVFSIYNYIISSKVIFGFDPAILESFLMIIFLVYFFFEKIKYDIQVSLYESKIFWIAAILFLFFAGNFFLFLYSNTMRDDPSFRDQYLYIYSSFNIFKNVFLSIALILKSRDDKDSRANKTIEAPFDNYYPFNNQNQ